jgi:hypothetical protein
MKFLVVVPTIRQGLPGFEEAIAAMRASFTQPTDFHVLDGKAGKSQTLNQALDDLVADADCDVYVTMDDDYLPPVGWQDDVEKAFQAVPTLGAVGLWLGESEEMQNSMGAHLIEEPTVVNGATLRRVKKGHHIVGCMIAFRREVIDRVGKAPETQERYQFWEDGWRGRRVEKLGYEMAFIESGMPAIFPYIDLDEYRTSKEADIAYGKANLDEILKQGGVQDPLAMKVRKAIARLRGRAR